ncbi:MAG: hypothetical protein HN348_07125 [Proteobacteria bacterium]|jgi:hypothetical protein|nr:hypothetical protein [Pseudomonadota bacterium]
MRVVLVGADIEENLGVAMIGAVAEAGGHEVRVLPTAIWAWDTWCVCSMSSMATFPSYSKEHQR